MLQGSTSHYNRSSEARQLWLLVLRAFRGWERDRSYGRSQGGCGYGAQPHSYCKRRENSESVNV